MDVKLTQPTEDPAEDTQNEHALHLQTVIRHESLSLARVKFPRSFRPNGVPLRWSPMSSSPSGDEDPYVSLNGLGEGGFGSVDEVYKRSNSSRIRYARKRFKRPTVRANERQNVFEKLRDEAGILRSISFRHIVELIECYTWKDNIFIVISPVAETDLAKFLAHLDSLQESPERNNARSVVLQ